MSNNIPRRDIPLLPYEDTEAARSIEEGILNQHDEDDYGDADYDDDERIPF